MTGRHAAPPDEAFDQQERTRLGIHRAEVDPALEDGNEPNAPAEKSAKPTRAQKVPTSKKASKR